MRFSKSIVLLLQHVANPIIITFATICHSCSTAQIKILVEMTFQYDSFHCHPQRAYYRCQGSLMTINSSSRRMACICNKCFTRSSYVMCSCCCFRLIHSRIIARILCKMFITNDQRVGRMFSAQKHIGVRAFPCLRCHDANE